MNLGKDFSFKYGKKAEIFEKYIYEITSDCREYVFIGGESEEVKTALETFGEDVDPEMVLGLYSRDGGEEGVLFTIGGIISYMPSDVDYDITDFCLDDEDEFDGDFDFCDEFEFGEWYDFNEDCELCDYCFDFKYADVKSISQVYDTGTDHFRTVPDWQMTVEITCKGKDRINFGLDDFNKSPLFSLISEMVELEKSLHSEEKPAEKTEPLIVITLLNPAL
jgi:hypothetical protein